MLYVSMATEFGESPDTLVSVVGHPEACDRFASMSWYVQIVYEES